jgi:NADPH:quinone reductase-like Zn-dependent oxidoreductase
VDLKVVTNWGGAPDATIAAPPRIPGWDASGVVEAVGSEATLFKVGDEVYFAGTNCAAPVELT